MTGALWAISAGIGFGVFQSINRRAVQGMDVYVATFLQLFVSAIVLSLASIFTEDIGLLFAAPLRAWLYFALGGFFHFFIGWTFLNASQKSIGAARTSSLIGTTPLFAIVVAGVTLAEIPTPISFISIFLIVFGVYLVNSVKISIQVREVGQPGGYRLVLLGLAAALCWAISPTFIRFGLRELDSPVLGVTLGFTGSVLAYLVVLIVRRLRIGPEAFAMSRESLSLKLLAGVLVGVSTWMRWLALDLAPVATVLALALVSVPTVNFLAPLISGRELENVTLQVWLGSLLIIGGSLVSIFLA